MNISSGIRLLGGLAAHLSLLALTWALGAGLVPAAKAQESAAPPGITIQPNLGDIDFDGGLAFAPDGKYLAISNRLGIKLWDVVSGRPLRLLEHPAYFERFAIVDGGARIFSMHKDGQFRLWDAATGALISSTSIEGIESETSIGALSVNPNRPLIAIATYDGTIVLWDHKARKARQRIAVELPDGAGAQLEAMDFARDGNTLIVAAGGNVRQFDALSGKEVSSVRLREGLMARPNGILGPDRLVAQAAKADCDAEIVLVTIIEGKARYDTLDAPPGCRKSPDGSEDENSFDSNFASYAASSGSLYVARKGGTSSKALALGSTTTAPVARSVPGVIVAVDSEARVAARLDGKGLRIIRLATGEDMALLSGQGRGVMFPVASADGRKMMLIDDGEATSESIIWPIAGVAPTFHSLRLREGFATRHAIPDTPLLLAGDEAGNFELYSLVSGDRTASFTIPAFAELDIARLSPDGRIAMVRGRQRKPGPEDDYSVTWLVDIASGSVITSFVQRPETPKADTDLVTAFEFSADSRRFALGWLQGAAEVWSLAPLKKLKRLDVADDQTTSLTFSPDNRHLIGGSRDSGIYVWSIETGKILRNLDREGVAGHVNTGSVGISHDSRLVAAGPRQRATSSGDVGRERRVQVWNATTGKPRFLLSGHEANVNALTFTKDGRWLVSGSNDGTIRYWHPETGRLGATFAAGSDGRWVIITEKGFFAASSDAGGLLSAVRGFEATSIDQLWQSLYAPDLVREFLAGDISGEVEKAVANTDLAKVLASGPAPAVTIVSPAPGSRARADLVDVEARIKDRGKGVGRIEWRVNGITAAVATKPEGAGSEFTISRQVALDPGENSIEVLTYNAGNLLASVPARSTVAFEAPRDGVKPALHVLVIGINAYVDTGWQGPGETERRGFLPLSLAVEDAKAVGDAFRQAGEGQYSRVVVTEALDSQATAAGLQSIIDRISPGIHPRDTFVLFAAAHGVSHAGSYYMIPQDFDGGANPAALQVRAIGQPLLQDWLANRIRAKRSIVLLDTCESGALVNGQTRTHTQDAATESAMGRLHEATGRPVLTAAAEGKPAFEGYEGHGVFTWALLDALRRGDSNGNGTIELTELVGHVQTSVPRIAEQLKGRGRAASRGIADDRQSARVGSRGEDFTLVRQMR